MCVQDDIYGEDIYASNGLANNMHMGAMDRHKSSIVVILLLEYLPMLAATHQDIHSPRLQRAEQKWCRILQCLNRMKVEVRYH
jgi:hypothetical protein